MTTTLRIQLGTLLALLLSACAPTTPHWDARFGESVRATMASQVADPAAVRNANPVDGIDGRAARAAHERYERSFARPEAEPVAPSGMDSSK